MPRSAPAEPRVLTQPGRVLSVTDREARIAVDAAAGCGGCAVKSGCAARALHELRGPHASVLNLPKQDGLRPGDKVAVAMPASDFVSLAALALLLPAVVFVGAVVVCSSLSLPVLPSIVISSTGLLLSLWTLRRAERRWRLVDGLRVQLIVAQDEPQL